MGGQCNWTRSRVSMPRLARERSVHCRKLARVYASGGCATRRPILVATVSPASGRVRRKRPISCSLRPSPYTSAVSRKVTPASTAAASTAMRVVLADGAPVGAELPGAEADHADGPAEPVEAALFHAAEPSDGLPPCHASRTVKQDVRTVWEADHVGSRRPTCASATSGPGRSTTWSPGSRPSRPRAVVDLGCGPGQLTATLADRWPSSRVAGLDSSPEMIDAGRAARRARSTSRSATCATGARPATTTWWSATRCCSGCPATRSCCAAGPPSCPPAPGSPCRSPATSTPPRTAPLREVADRPTWRAEVAPLLRADPVDDPADYAGAADRRRLRGGRLGDYLRAPAAGSARRRAPGAGLDGGHRAAPGPGRAGRRRLVRLPRRAGVRLTAAYPVRQGQVYFPFRRVFVVARTGARAQENP